MSYENPDLIEYRREQDRAIAQVAEAVENLRIVNVQLQEAEEAAAFDAEQANEQTQLATLDPTAQIEPEQATNQDDLSQQVADVIAMAESLGLRCGSTPNSITAEDYREAMGRLPSAVTF